MFKYNGDPVPELIEKIKQAKTEEELVALAKENGLDLYAPSSNRDIRRKLKFLSYTDIRLTPRANILRPDLKYDMSAYRFYGDYGTRYDPFPKNFAICRMLGIEFLVRKKIVPDLKYDPKTPLVRRFIARFARYHNERDMYIGINVCGEPYISSSAIIDEPEKFSVDDVNVVTEKGAFDINDEKDKSLIAKLADRYKNQRVILAYEGEPGSLENRTTYCIIPYEIALRNDICYRS